MECAGASGGVNLGRRLGRRRCRSAARAGNRDQHEGRYQITEPLHGRAEVIAAVAVAIIAILARRLTLTGRQVTHGGFTQGGFTQGEFAWLRITVPPRRTIPPGRIAAFLGFGTRATFCALTPRGGFGGHIFRRFRARRAV